MSISDINFREGVYRQIYEGAYAVARAQQPDIAAHAQDINALRLRILSQRLRFMADLRSWPSFSRGWARRIADLMEA